MRHHVWHRVPKNEAPNHLEDGAAARLLAQQHVLGLVHFGRDEGAAAGVGVVGNHDAAVSLLDLRRRQDTQEKQSIEQAVGSHSARFFPVTQSSR